MNTVSPLQGDFRNFPSHQELSLYSAHDSLSLWFEA